MPDDRTVPLEALQSGRVDLERVWREQMAVLQAALPQYEWVELAGCGGMGAVFKARQKSLNRMVAIKILPPETADDELRFVERFRNEAATMARLAHPAIVHVHDFGETADGLFYFVMEFVEGTDLQKLIQASGRLEPEHALRITADVCDALAYAHKRGVIHRDIKPANILIDTEGRVKVADFGLAKMQDTSRTSALTRSNVAMGTPDYVAPEVLSPGMMVDHRADLYAVGVMLYQMLTGEVPRGMFKLPSEKSPGSDPRFDEVICKAMEQDREERYQTASDVRQALESIRTTPLTALKKTGVRPQRSRAMPKAQPPSHSRLKWGAAVVGVVALGSAAFFALNGGKDPPAIPQASTIAHAASPAPTAAPFRTIDLLALVDLDRDVLEGDWLRTADGIAKQGVSSVGGHHPRVRLPYVPPAEYDIEFEFTPGKGGAASLGIWMSAESRLFSWILGGGASTMSAGFEQFDLKPTSVPSEVVTTLPNPLVQGRRYRSRVEVRADGLRGYLEDEKLVDWAGRGKFARLGRAVSSPDDARPCLRAARDVVFHKVTVREISGPGKVGAALTPASKPAWTDQLAARDWRSPWIFEGGALRSTDKNPTAYLGRMTDGALRVRFQPEPEKLLPGNNPPLQISLRSSYNDEASEVRASYQIQIYPERRISHLLYLAKGPPGQNDPPPEYLWKDKPWPETGEVTDLEIRAEGENWTLLHEGQTIASAQDSRVTSGSCVMMASPGVRILKLETLGVAKEAEPVRSDIAAPLPPDVFPWQDVTGTVREKAKGIPQLLVEADAVAHSTRGSPVMMPVSPGVSRGLAVRLTHAGDGQVNWRSPSGGILYVLCQRTQTIIQRHAKDAAAPVKLVPDVPHPASHNHAKPHELLVTLEGPLLRAWLDGRFIGELRDETFTGGSCEIVISKWGDVRKVEIAELHPPARVWTDWLGPKLAAGGFAGAQWKREAGGISTDRVLAGFDVLPQDTRDGAVKVTFAMRGSEGVILDCRETKESSGRHLYSAQYTVKNLYIAHSPPDVSATKRLISEPVAEELRARDEHTLEFRFIGEDLTATLDGVHRVTARHSLLKQGLCAVVLTKGVLVKKVETQALDSPR